MHLLKSRKFLILLLDVVASIAGYYLVGDDARFLIAAIQPVVLAVIIGITVEDAAALRAGTHRAQR